MLLAPVLLQYRRHGVRGVAQLPLVRRSAAGDRLRVRDHAKVLRDRLARAEAAGQREQEPYLCALQRNLERHHNNQVLLHSVSVSLCLSLSLSVSVSTLHLERHHNNQGVWGNGEVRRHEQRGLG